MVDFLQRDGYLSFSQETWIFRRRIFKENQRKPHRAGHWHAAYALTVLDVFAHSKHACLGTVEEFDA